MENYEIEDSALNRAMTCGEAASVFAVAEPGMFSPGPRQELAFMLSRLREHQDLATAAMNEARRTGAIAVVRLIPDIVSVAAMSSGAYYAGFVAVEHARREVLAIATRLAERSKTVPGEELPELLDMAASALKEVQTPYSTADDDAWDLDYFAQLERETHKFTFPRMLTREERFLMVGKEGGGKSTLVYQMLTGASYGVNTMSYENERYEPQRVVFLDVENNPYQIADQVRLVHGLLRELAPDVKPYWKNLKRKVVDLTDKNQQASVIRSIVGHQPDVLYMGTAYKMAFSEDYRVMARSIMSTVDRIRAEVGCTTLIEHHAGWGEKGNRNGWRPDGTSEWARWADFARGMDVKYDERGTRRVMKMIVSSRMDRSAGRDWPGGFVQGRGDSTFPWVPVHQDEFDARYDQLFAGQQ